MLGKRISIASSLFCLPALAVFGADADYFPLMIGNSWVYRTTQATVPDVQTAEVTGTTFINSQNYFRVRFFGRELLLRKDEKNILQQYDSDSQSEKVWLDATGVEGSSVPANLDSCTASGTIQSSNAQIKVPAAEFQNALQLVFQPVCADAGITEAFLVPYTGFARITWTSIAGPRVYDLVYSRTGVTELSDKQTSFRISLDQDVYTPSRTLMVRLTLRSTQSDPVTLNFPTGQDADVAIRNEKGETVYLWSSGKAFPQIYRTVKFGPGEKNVVLTLPLPSLPPGKYTAEGYLKTEPRVYVATIPFELRNAQ